MRAARPLAVVLALVAAAWFAVGIRQSHAIATATRLITPGSRGVGEKSLTAVQRARARSLLDKAALLYPGDRVRILRADLTLDEGRAADARRALERLGHERPDDLAVWVALAAASADSPATFRAAARQVRRLVPVVRR